MQMLKFFGIALAAIVAAAALGSGASANTRTAAQADLSTSRGVHTYLRSLGLDPSHFVVQRGAHNYAGLRCPGKNWSCTTSRRVLQISTATAASNSATCTPQDASSSLGNAAAYSCVIIQVSLGGGTNTGTCNLTTDDSASGFSATPPAIGQSCTINQKIDPAAKKTGKNVANVTQSITQGAARSCGLIGTDQQCVDTQKVVIGQSNTSGPSTATVTQAVNQSLSTTGATVGQAQASKMSFDIRQNYPDAPATGDPGYCSTIQGSASATVTQTLTQTENAGTATSGLQYQNSDIAGTVNQCSNSKSSFTVSQNENQTQLPNSTVPGVMRTQIGPGGIYCCSFQGTNPGDTCTINATTNQSSPGAVQIEAVESRVNSFGTCGGTISETQNGATTQSTPSGGTFDNGLACLSGSPSCLNAGLASISTSFPSIGVNPKSPETTVDYGDVATLTATLQRDDAPPSTLAGLPVLLAVDGQLSETCATYTNASGVASCDVTLADTPGTHSVSASFSGAGPFKSASGSSTFTVAKETTVLTYSPPDATSVVKEKQTGYVTLSAKLTEDGNALSGKPVAFNVNGAAATCLSPSTATTGTDGVASCRVNPPPGNSIVVDASFTGDQYYSGSSFAPVTLAVVSH